MKIDVLGSGSKGNCYKVNIGDATLLMECGLPFNVIKRKLKFKLSEIDACFITHEHLDHAKAINEIMGAGIDVYATNGTFNSLKVGKSHRKNIINKDKINSKYNYVNVKNVRIYPFESVHDVAEPVNFYIKDMRSKESIFFVTDTAYIKYKIPEDIDILMIECNYIKSVIDKNLEDKKLNTSLRNRIVKNHMSLETTIKAIKDVKFTRLKKVYALHLSDNNSSQDEILEALQKATGVPVEVC